MRTIRNEILSTSDARHFQPHEWMNKHGSIGYRQECFRARFLAMVACERC